jgi:hypothetical protein
LPSLGDGFVRIISVRSPSGLALEAFSLKCSEMRGNDFADPRQERIRQELHIEGVEYAYKAGTATGTAGQRFVLTEATVALACASPDVALAVQAKREISKLWEDLAKAPYKQLFNSGVPAHLFWKLYKPFARLIRACRSLRRTMVDATHSFACMAIVSSSGAP